MLLPETKALLVWLAITVALVLVTAVLGRRGRRRPHIVSAVTTTAALVYTIYRAEVLGRVLDIPPTVKWIHLTFANLAFVAFLCVVATGLRLFRLEEALRRRLHRRAVVAFLVLVGIATATGTWMLYRSSPRAVAPAAASVR